MVLLLLLRVLLVPVMVLRAWPYAKRASHTSIESLRWNLVRV